MKSNLIFLIFLFSGNLLSAQTFTQVGENPFTNSTHGTVIFGDVNGDGAPDALFSGNDFFNSPASTTLYLNDGAGNFTEKPNTSILGVSAGVFTDVVAFVDVDGNQTLDVFISGPYYWNGGNITYITKLYLNNGAGNFTEKFAPGLNSIHGHFAFADVDGNNTPDVIISDFNNTKLYLNDGTGNFTEKPDTASVFITSAEAAFADIDGNNTQDLILSGNGPNGLATYIYLNDSSGNFTIKSTMQAIGGSYTFADVDGNNTLDMLLSGIIYTTQVENVTKLYLNDGAGNFTEQTGTPFVKVKDGSAKFTDVDGNNTMDLLITGNKRNSGTPFEPVTKLYLNDGLGNFTEKTGTSFENIHRSSVAVADVDGDSTLDILMSGTAGLTNSSAIFHKASLYFNDGMGNFEQKPNASLAGISQGTAVFEDMDGNNTQDILISGVDSSGSVIKLYRNNGKSVFSENPEFQIEGLSYGSLAVADVTGDSLPDVLISGFNDSGFPVPYTRLYTNDSSGAMTEVIPGHFLGLAEGMIALEDVNGDNKADVIITGVGILGNVTKLYINQGNLNFPEKTNTPFEGVKNSAFALADVDGNSTQDILLTGYTGTERIAKLYLNDGSGNFSEKSGTPFEGVEYGSVAFADVDGNQTKDVLITGATATGRIARLYLNDGTGNFTEQTGTPFEGIANSSVSFADADGNQSMDLLIAGHTGSERITKLYLNNGSGSFYEHTEVPFEIVINGGVAFGDVNGDSTLDVLIAGQDTSFVGIARLYLNEGGMFTSIDRESVEEVTEFLLYPNPTAEGEVYIDLPPSGPEPTLVRILDIHGRIVASHQILGKTNQQTFSLNISSLKPGYYIVQVYRDHKGISRKMIVR